MRILRGFVTLNEENAGGVRMASWREYFACGQVVELEEDGPDVRAEVSGR